MAMLDETDLDFDSQVGSRWQTGWRPVTERDLSDAILLAMLFVGLLVYGVLTHLHIGLKLYVYTILWLLLVCLQVQRVVVLFRKYRNGEEIKARVIMNARKDKE